MTRGGVLGTPAVLRARPRRKVDRGAPSGFLVDAPTPTAAPTPWAAPEPAALELGGCDGTSGTCFLGDFTTMAEGVLRGQSSGKEDGTQKITKIRYLLVDADVLSSLQRPEDTADARRSFPLAELLEVHAKSTEALNVAASLGHSGEVLRGAISGVPGCGELSGAASPRPPVAFGDSASGAACCIVSATNVPRSWVPEDDAPGAPGGVRTSALVPPASRDARPVHPHSG